MIQSFSTVALSLIVLALMVMEYNSTTYLLSMSKALAISKAIEVIIHRVLKKLMSPDSWQFHLMRQVKQQSIDGFQPQL
jgi:hypothetical protein